MRKPLFAIAGLALLASTGFASLATVGGADHKDSPSVSDTPAVDNTDLYAFRSPANNDNLVIVAGFNPLTAPSDNARTNFDPQMQMQIEVDRTGDPAPEATATLRFTENPLTLVVEGLGPAISAPVTPPGQANPIITEAGGVKVFAGLREDPFFFDLQGFMMFASNPQAPVSGLRPAGAGQATDTFAGTNVSMIVLEVPITALTGANNANTGTIKVVGNINRGGPVDRVAIPAVNTALVPPNQKNAFNQARDEAQDAATFRPGVLASINTFRGAVDGLLGGAGTQDGGPLGRLTSEQVADALLPYQVTIDFSKPVQFPNGRRLQDDVIDAALQLVVNRSGVGDGVNSNDRQALSTFPYVAEPFPAMQMPRTGDGGLLDRSDDKLWMMSGALFLLAIAFGGAGVFAVVRARGR